MSGTQTIKPNPVNIEMKDLPGIINCSLTKAYQLTKEPGFPAFRLGRKILINRERLNEWIDAQITTSRNAQ